MVEQTIVYKSPFDLNDCIDRILEAPQQYSCELGTPLYFEAHFSSRTQGEIVFKGGRFRRGPKRSTYSMSVTATKEGTFFVLKFVKELFGVSSMTPITDIDLCMVQRLKAERIIYKYEGHPFPLWSK